MTSFDREGSSGKPEASLAYIFSSLVRAWFATKLCFMKELGGPMIDKTDILVTADRIGELSNIWQFSTKNVIPLMDSSLMTRRVPHPSLLLFYFSKSKRHAAGVNDEAQVLLTLTCLTFSIRFLGFDNKSRLSQNIVNKFAMLFCFAL